MDTKIFKQEKKNVKYNIFFPFQNVVVFLTWLVMYLIPDIPYKVKMQMLRENFLSKEALYQAESIKYNPMRGGTPNNGTDITDRTIF